MNSQEERDAIICMLGSPEMNPQRFKSFFSRHMNEALEHIGLTESQAIFIKVLSDNEGQSLRVITDKVCMDKSLTTRTIKTLMDKGWIENVSEVGNEHSIVLTDEGAKIKAVADEVFHGLVREILKDIDDDELPILYNAMRKMINTISKMSEE